MLTPTDQLGMRRELESATLPYRETLVVIPVVTTGSNYEEFTDSPYDITGALSGQKRADSFTVYRLRARVKIVKDTTFLGVNPAITGLEVGDYLLYFSDVDAPVIQELISPVNDNAYLVIDGITMRPYNSTLNGLGQTFDVFVHAKKYYPKMGFRKEGT